MNGGRVALHRLTFVDDGDHVVVGRPDIESYAVFPIDGAALLQRLRDGSTLAEASEWYEQTYHDTVDVDDFLETLEDLGFLRDPDTEQSAAGTSGSHAGTEWGPDGSDLVSLRALARAVFSPAAAAFYAIVVLAALVALVRVPAVRPTPSTVFFTRSLVVVQLSLVLAELPLIFLHEFFHMLAGRRIGLPSRLSVGRRLHFVVFQTTMTTLFSVPPRRRYLPLLAGMMVDTVVFGVLVLGATADHASGGSLSTLGRLAVAMAYLTALRVAWQFLVVMETDVQHVLATALRCTGLGRTTAGYLWARIRRVARWLVGRRGDEREQPYYSPREQAVLRWFAPLTALGVMMLVGLALVTAGPVLAGLVSRIGRGLSAGFGSAGFWDALVALVLLLAQFGLLFFVSMRQLVTRLRQARRARRSSISDRSVPR